MLVSMTMPTPVRLFRVPAILLATGLLATSIAGAGPAASMPPPDRLLATGQLTGFVGNDGATGAGNRDDGDLLHGRAPDFEVHAGVPATAAENLVVDHNTGLMWIRDLDRLNGTNLGGVGGNRRLDQSMTWQVALDTVAILDYAGFDDWRLPSINELSTLVDFGRLDPALDPAVFPEDLEALVLSPYFWSSTTSPSLAFEAYYVNFYNGHQYPYRKTYQFSVRPVRDMATTDPVAVMQSGQSVRNSPGDDGDRRPGLAPDYTWADDGTLDTPAENVVLDRHTDLAWLRDPLLLDGSGGLGGNQDLHSPRDWQAAVTACAGLQYDGFDDWRLPNIRELESITLLGRPGMPQDPQVFPHAPISPDPEHPWHWWSSTTAFGEWPNNPRGTAAWYVTTATPVMRHVVSEVVRPAKAVTAFARCVRDTVAPVRPALYLPEVRSYADFDGLTIAPDDRSGEREGKFLLAVPGTSAPFETAFQDVHQHSLHFEFLVAAFPDEFTGLTAAEYDKLVATRTGRRFFVGGLRRFATVSGVDTYGFDVYTAPGKPEELLSAAETAAVYRALAQRFRRRPFVYAPTTPEAKAAAEAWTDPGFPIDFPVPPPPVGYEVYTPGVAYGTVRLVTLAELPELVASGSLGWQDIAVLDRAPTDLETIVAAIVTGDRQGELSHLNVRAARRGTPNLYLRDGGAALAPYAGHLVRLTATQDGYVVVPDVPAAEAAAWWAAQRPEPVAIPFADRQFDELPALAELGAAADVARIGGKAANLAQLYSFLPARYQLPALAIPFKAYTDYLDENSIQDDRALPPGRRTLAEHIAALHADPHFLTEPAYRAERLDALRVAIDDGKVSPELVARLAARVEEVFGPGVMVRFRSSSNAEDGVRFNGAGLYDSTSVCPADSLDADNVGPSLCDPSQPKERTIQRGLHTVWASTWNLRAWTERAWYGMAQTEVGMALLVTPAFPDEQANGVAFTGNPSAPVPGEYLVNAQAGDVSVVLPDPGVLPERSLLTVADGQVTSIRRVRPSSIVPPGTQVMPDAALRDLGSVLALAEEKLPIDLQGYARSDVLMDVEFKLRRPDGQLVLKQIRPFLATDDSAHQPSAALHLEVPAPVTLCTLWRPAYPITQEHAERATLALAPGLTTLPVKPGQATHDLFGDLRYGPAATLAEPVGPGTARVVARPEQPGFVRVELSRDYRVAGRVLQARLSYLDVRADALNVRLLNADALTAGSAYITLQPPDDPTPSQVLSPCGLDLLPGHRLDITFDAGQHATLHVKKGRGFQSYHWADLVAAEVTLAAGTREVHDFHQLAYDAQRHNWNEEYLVVFDPPLGDAHALVIAQEGTATGEGDYRATLLDATFEVVRHLPVGAVQVVPEGDGGGVVYLPRVLR
jgi:hypothetical protein